MEDKLKEYGLHVEHNEWDDREPIDFELRDDDHELYATVWGSEPWNDVQIDCNHDFVEYDDDETVGECPICGATCDWHWQNNSEGYREKYPHEWHHPDKIGGIVGEYLEELGRTW